MDPFSVVSYHAIARNCKNMIDANTRDTPVTDSLLVFFAREKGELSHAYDP